jgi:hypothetical protein
MLKYIVFIVIAVGFRNIFMLYNTNTNIFIYNYYKY